MEKKKEPKQPPPPRPKKPYSTPHLKVYGRLDEITKSEGLYGTIGVKKSKP